MPKFRLPSDYVLETLSIVYNEKEINIKEMMMGLDISEDLYVAGTTGVLHINDTLDMYDTVPIRGGEILKIKFMTDSDATLSDASLVYEKEFVIIGIKNIEQGGNVTSKHYTIEFVSKIYLANHENKISRKYNASVSDIVKDIYHNVLGLNDRLDIEDTKLTEEIIVPNWTPIKTIEHLSTLAQSTNRNDVSYLFYEDKDGFNFKSIHGLGQAKSTRTMSMNNVWAAGESAGENRNIITNLEIVKIPDLMDGIVQGRYGGRLNIINDIDKTYKQTTFEYDKDIHSRGLINDNKLRSYPVRQSDQKHYTIMGRYTGKNAQATKLKRHSRMSQLDAYVLLIKCPNWTRQKLGDVVTLDIKSAINKSTINTNVEEINQTTSGKYIIRAIRHIIALGGYDTVIELAKDSY